MLVVTDPTPPQTPKEKHNLKKKYFLPREDVDRDKDEHFRVYSLIDTICLGLKQRVVVSTYKTCNILKPFVTTDDK